MASLSTFFITAEESVAYLILRAMKQLGLREVRDIKRADVVFTYFSDEESLEDAYYDSEGLIQLVEPATNLDDLSPASPNFINELFGVAEVSDMHFVAAPLAFVDQVSEDAFARDNLFVLTGGETADLDMIEPLLESFAHVRRIGQAPQAQMARAAHTINQTARLIAAVETEAFYSAINGANMGFTGDVSEAIKALPEDDIRTRTVAAIFDKRFTGDYTVDMMSGEIEAALLAADDIELILPQLEAALSLVDLFNVVSIEDRAPAAMSLLFASEEEGERNGISWQRAQEFMEKAGMRQHGEDAEGECCHHHHHAHDDVLDVEAYGFERFGDDYEYDDDDDYGDEEDGGEDK